MGLLVLRSTIVPVILMPRRQRSLVVCVQLGTTVHAALTAVVAAHSALASKGREKMRNYATTINRYFKALAMIETLLLQQ